MFPWAIKRWANRRIIGLIFLLIIFFLLSFYQTLLKKAGDFLAPEKIEEAEVIIIESSELIREKAIKIGMDFLSQKRGNFLIVVYQNSPEEKVFGRPSDYRQFLITKLETMGLNIDKVSVIEVPKEHPITLIEAKIVLPHLAQRGFKRAILIAESFHTRRSLWAYTKIGREVGIKIYPYPFFTKFKKDQWWRNRQGIREFFTESVKFLYYLFYGYIPIESLWKI